jgi:hypothetical protein
MILTQPFVALCFLCKAAPAGTVSFASVLKERTDNTYETQSASDPK